MKTNPSSKEHQELRNTLFNAAKELFSVDDYHKVIRMYEKEYNAVVDIGIGNDPGTKAASVQPKFEETLALLNLNNDIIFETESLHTVGDASNQLCKNKEKSE